MTAAELPPLPDEPEPEPEKKKKKKVKKADGEARVPFYKRDLSFGAQVEGLAGLRAGRRRAEAEEGQEDQAHDDDPDVLDPAPCACGRAGAASTRSASSA